MIMAIHSKHIWKGSLILRELFRIIGKSSELSYDTKKLREDAHANAEEIVA